MITKVFFSIFNFIANNPIAQGALAIAAAWTAVRTYGWSRKRDGVREANEAHERRALEVEREIYRESDKAVADADAIRERVPVDEPTPIPSYLYIPKRGADAPSGS